MANEEKATTIKTESVTPVVRSEAKPGMGRPQNRRNDNRSNFNSRNKQNKRHNPDDVEKRIVTIRRVSHTYKGGKRMSLSVLVVVGDRNGSVGAAIGKGPDVKSAEIKAYNKAKKKMVKIHLNNTTIPHEIFHKKGAVKIFMKPAAPGTGVIAGASLRSVLELVGVKDILTKIIGASNPITNVYATIEALQSMKQ